MGRKLTKQISSGARKPSGKASLTRFLLTAGWGDQTAAGEWWRIRNPVRYQGWSDTEDGGFSLNWLNMILLKSDSAEINIEIQKLRPSWKTTQRGLSWVWSRKESVSIHTFPGCGHLVIFHLHFNKSSISQWIFTAKFLISVFIIITLKAHMSFWTRIGHYLWQTKLLSTLVPQFLRVGQHNEN